MKPDLDLQGDRQAAGGLIAILFLCAWATVALIAFLVAGLPGFVVVIGGPILAVIAIGALLSYLGTTAGRGGR